MPSDLPFRDRDEAGRALAELATRSGWHEPLVLAIPRGGVPVAAPLSRALTAPLDVIVVRKLGAPGNPELAVGAVGSAGPPVIDTSLQATLGIGEEYLSQEIEAQRAEARRREEAFRGTRAIVETWPGDVIVVDDGIATGRTVEAAAQLLRPRVVGRLVLGVPVGPPPAVERLEGVYDEVLCVHAPEPYMAVGQWYVDFHQVGDDEVRQLLDRGGV